MNSTPSVTPVEQADLTSPSKEGISQASRDRLGPVWDFSQERAFMETLAHQRFNFFLLFYAVIVAGALNCSSVSLCACIVTSGVLILILMALGMNLVFRKLRISIEEFLYKDESHPARIVHKINQRQNKMHWLWKYFPESFSVRSFYSTYIPAICILSLVMILFIRLY